MSPATLSEARRALLARVVARRPVWRIVFRYGNARLVGTVGLGIARDPAEAIAWYCAHRPVAAGYDGVEATPR